jgi:hypothetical protein
MNGKMNGKMNGIEGDTKVEMCDFAGMGCVEWD